LALFAGSGGDVRCVAARSAGAVDAGREPTVGVGSGTGRSTMRDAASSTGARVLCHHAPPSTSTAASSTPITTNAQRGICGGGVASGTWARPGSAERWRSCSDLRSASRMNDTSVVLDESGRVREMELGQHRNLRPCADDAVDRQLMRALIGSHAVLE
jgi:hypothetical protein